MASRTTTDTKVNDNSMKGICRRLLLHRKKDSESQHPLIAPTASSAVGPTKSKKSKKDRKGFLLRGLGCASSPPHAAHVPESAASAAAEAMRSSAEWPEKRSRKGRGGRRKKKKQQRRERERERERGQVTSSSGVADVSEVWCAPSGVVFGANAAVDCVVAHRRGRSNRERPSTARNGGNEEMLSSLLDFPSSMEAQHFGSELLNSGRLRYMRGGYRRRRSPAEFEEVMMLQTRVLVGGTDVYDQYRDLRLDVDNMSYEELLELSEKIGYVSTGLREEEILRNLQKPKHPLSSASPSQREWKCIICQEEYEANDDMGRLECGHSYHTYCIKQWLLRKNACPVCKTAITKS